MTLGKLLALAGVFLFTMQPAWGKNYALLIGNSAYSIGTLDNPANDARDLAAVLKATGFETTVILNQNAEAMTQAIRAFGEKLRNNDGIGFFFFAGHGVQVAGENYLLPVGFPFRNENEVQANAVSANLVLRYMEDAKSRVNVIVLDACRNNPFIKTRSLKNRGLAPMDAPSGSLVAFSTAPGTEASDGSGSNGLYTKHLMSNLKVPGLTVEQVFKRVREAVENESERELGRKQSPREESSLKGGEIYFIPPPVAVGSSTNAEAVELAYWNSIANSSNTADFDSYLAQYPKGKFADLARNRLKAAKAGQPVGRAEMRGDMQAQPARPSAPMVTASTGKVYSSPGNFSFSDDGETSMRAAELISISCRDVIKGKWVRLAIEEKGSIAQKSRNAFRQSIEERMKALGVKVAAAGAAADFVMKGTIETATGANPILGIGEVDLDAEFSLSLPSGKRLAGVSATGGAYSARNTGSAKGAALGVWEEKSEEIVGKLFRDYCADR